MVYCKIDHVVKYSANIKSILYGCIYNFNLFRIDVFILTGETEDTGNGIAEDGMCIFPDQIFSTCAPDCDATCDMPVPQCTRLCVQRCHCPFGTLLHTGNCISQDECPAT